jgi:uridine kinase
VTVGYVVGVLDLSGRCPLDVPVKVAPNDAMLIADGAFLQRPELDRCWDLVVYVDVSFDEVLRRGVARDRAFTGSAAEAERRYLTRYIPGEQRYLDAVRPGSEPTSWSPTRIRR